MKFFLFGLIFISLHSLAQISIKEIRIQPNKKFYNTNDSTIRYPVITIDHGKVEWYINKLIAETIIGDDYQTDSVGRQLSVKEQLVQWSNDWLDQMDYSVTFNRNNLLSIEFTMEGVAAYLSTYSNQINIDLQARKVLTFADIIEPGKAEELKKNLHEAKLKVLENNLKQLKGDEDTSYFKRAVEETQYCIEDDSIENFLFREKNIQFIDDCDFPHVMQNMAPVIELVYAYSEMKNYLKSEFLKRITEE